MRKHIGLVAVFFVGGCLGSVPTGGGDSGGGSGDPASSGGGGAGGGGGGMTPANLRTYYADALPVFQRNCMPCHASGGSGTPALDRYDSASTSINAIFAAIDNGTMPPFPPAAGCSSYVDELRLSAADKAILVDWAQSGTPEGDAAAAPPYSPPAPSLGTPDRTLGAVTFTPVYPGSAGPNDLYWCFPLDPGISVATDVVAAEVIPGTLNEVHHVIIARDPGGVGTKGKPASGFECNGVPGQLMYAWVPGARPFQLPAGVGMKLSPGDKLYMQMHYHRNPSVTPSPDATTTRLYYAKSTQAQHAWTVWTGTPTFTIPPNTTGFKVSANCTVTGDWQVIGVAPHMHTLGTAFDTSTKASGASACLMKIPRWDFNWQGGYGLQQPLVLKPGDTIATQCTYNNNTAVPVSFGESTGNEMCFGFLTVIAASQPTFVAPVNVVTGLTTLCAL
ncbi:MAG: monooxygenase [Polyangia bacterium]